MCIYISYMHMYIYIYIDLYVYIYIHRIPSLMTMHRHSRCQALRCGQHHLCDIGWSAESQEMTIIFKLLKYVYIYSYVCICF